MKNIILSLLCTSFLIGFAIFLATSHVELMAISGSIILLIIFYIVIKYMLDEIKGE